VFDVFDMRLILATLLTLAAFPATALAAPDVTTGDATSVGQTTATLTGTITPDGTDAPYVFEYGTTTEYGLTAGAGTGPAAGGSTRVEAALTGLSPETTYHYRLVSGDVDSPDRAEGEDRTFTTAEAPPQPSLPTISARGYTERTATSLVLKARIDPNRAATSYHVEWGYSDDLGRRTPEGRLPVGDTSVALRFPLTGLSAYTRIYWQVVATNAAGTKRSTILSVRTRRDPTGISARVSDSLARWSEGVTVSGHVDGAGISGMTVALEQATFPFTSPFAAVATTRVNSSGDFSFRSRQALIGTRWRVVTRSTPSFTSNELSTAVRPRLSTRITRLKRRYARLKATVSPGLPGATAILQRRSASGRWFAVKRKSVNTIDELRSTVFFAAKRKRSQARSFRVKVKPASEAYVAVKGSSVRVARRPRDKG
jgi:hypothetical protein